MSVDYEVVVNGSFAVSYASGQYRAIQESSIIGLN